MFVNMIALLSISTISACERGESEDVEQSTQLEAPAGPVEVCNYIEEHVEELTETREFVPCYDSGGQEMSQTRVKDAGNYSYASCPDGTGAMALGYSGSRYRSFGCMFVTLSDGDNCDYSNSDSNGGWGGDPVSRKSCPPANASDTPPANNCDYSNSSSNGGWGWDPVSRTSCPPL